MTEYILRTAVIHGADHGKKLYRVQLCDNPPDERYAIPLGGLHTFSNDTGTVTFSSYTVGEKVLVVAPGDNWSSRTSLLWIIGALPILDNIKKPEKKEPYQLFPGELSKLSSQLPEVMNSMLQDPGFLDKFDAIENSPADLKAGDWSINGQNTIVNVDDYGITLKAGSSRVSLESILNTLTESSLFRSIYSAGERTRTRYYCGSLITSREFSGLFADSYKKDPLFKYQEQLSDILHGYSRAVLNDQKTPITLYSEELDGTLTAFAAGTVKVGRSSRLPWYSLKPEDAVITNEGEGIHPEDPDKPLQPILSSDEWDKKQLFGTPGSVYETTFDVVGVTEWETPDTSDVSTFYDSYTGVRQVVSNKESGILCLPDGTVLIRDGFGSEIRMCHGNIQISSANNTTILGGRDILQIASGIIMSNAGSGVEIGSGAGDIAIGTKKKLRVSAEDYSLYALKRTVKVDGTDLKKCPEVIIDSSRILLNSGGEITAVSPSVRISGTGRVVINSSQAALCVESNAITSGATVFTVHGNVKVSKGKFSVSSATDSNYNIADVVVPASSGAVMIGGPLVVAEIAVANDGIQTAGGVYSSYFAAYTPTVYGLKNPPKKQPFKDRDKEYDRELAAKDSILETLKKFKEMLSSKAINAIQNVFTRISKSCKIYKPPFSKTVRGGSVNPATCSTGTSEVSYIYPGKAFWTKDGLVTESAERFNMTVKRDLSYSGASSVSLNSPNVINNE